MKHFCNGYHEIYILIIIIIIIINIIINTVSIVLDTEIQSINYRTIEGVISTLKESKVKRENWKNRSTINQFKSGEVHKDQNKIH